MSGGSASTTNPTASPTAWPRMEPVSRSALFRDRHHLASTVLAHPGAGKNAFGAVGTLPLHPIGICRIPGWDAPSLPAAFLQGDDLALDLPPKLERVGYPGKGFV